MTAQKQAVKHLFAVTAYYGRARGHERHVKSLEDALETIQYRLEEPSVTEVRIERVEYDPLDDEHGLYDK